MKKWILIEYSETMIHDNNDSSSNYESKSFDIFEDALVAAHRLFKKAKSNYSEDAADNHSFVVGNDFCYGRCTDHWGEFEWQIIVREVEI